MRSFFFLLLISWCVLLCSCLGEEDYTVSATDLLRLEKDTLSLDTVMAGEPTNTYTFQVHNPGKKSIRIVRTSLQKGSKSPFRINIDGTFLKDGAAGELEIARKDSLRVFVQLDAPSSNLPQPIEVEDTLIFRLASGIEQTVLLTAAVQGMTTLRGWEVERDTTLTADLPYRILDSLVVKEGATLTLRPGVRLYFHPSADLKVNGTLQAIGTVQQPIEMRGDRLGYMFSNQPYDRIPSQWGGVVFSKQSFGNKIDHCSIHSGEFGIRCDSSALSQEKLRLTNSVVHNVGGDGLYAKSCRLYVGNSQITNAAGDCVRLIGGNHTFVHCTIGQFYALTGRRGVALRFTNHDGRQRFPLEKNTFNNCLITGYNNDDIMGEQSERYKKDAFEYAFDHCLLNTPPVTGDSHFKDCHFEQDYPENKRQENNFYPRFDLQKLLFTFLLDSQSPAIGMADVAISQATFPLDLNGRHRIVNGKAAVGCYTTPVVRRP